MLKYKRINNNNKYVIFWNDRYFVVNSFTKDVLNEFYMNQNISYLSKHFNISKKQVVTLYKHILKLMNEAKYYDNDLLLDTPLKIQWKIIDKCNLKCRHCYLGELSQSILPIDKILKITDKIIASDVMEVTLTGGEALIFNNLDIIVKKLIENDIRVKIFTNGILLKGFIEKIKHINNINNYLTFSISIDGLKDSNDKIRGEGTFYKVIESIKYAKKAGFKIISNTVLNNINYLEVPKLLSILHDIGVDKIQISNVIENDKVKNLSLSKEQKKTFENALITSLGNIKNFNGLYYCQEPDDENYNPIYFLKGKDKIFLQNENWICSAGRTKITIDYNGNVFCCPFIKTLKLGNILDNDLKDIWLSDNRLGFLNRLLKKNNKSRVCIALRGEDYV